MYSLVFCFFLYLVFYYVTLLYLKCSIVLRVRIKDDDDAHNMPSYSHDIGMISVRSSARQVSNAIGSKTRNICSCQMI